MEGSNGGNFVDTLDILSDTSTPAAPRPVSRRCSGCGNRHTCLPSLLKPSEYPDLERIVYPRRLSQRGGRLYNQHEPCRSIFIVRSGSIMFSEIAADGAEQVLGFCYPGQLVGPQGFGKEVYPGNATAMEPSVVCEISYEALCLLARALPKLQTVTLRMLSDKIVQDQKLMRLLSKAQADQRVAAFLLLMSDMHRRRGLPAKRLVLPMSRSDIASYLGVTIETVSRWISEFARLGIITASHHDVRLLDIDALREIVQGFGR